ncbi:MAG: hypothetical protein SVY10_10325 [Thermodesulfobacteriota bacterium]|nr:hypothetical protein [Thermodesulfobacteriota bacterium]
MKRMVLCLIIFLGVAFPLLINGCMPRRALTTEQTSLSPIKVERIGVMPFLKGKNYANIDDPTDRTLNCRLDQLCFNTDNLQSKADEILTRFMWNAMEKKFGERLVPHDNAIELYKKIVIDRDSDTPRSLARKLGKELKAHHMVLGVVWRYRDRVGSAIAVERPASVAFAIYAIHVESGGKLWKRVFDQTQQSLSENVLNAPDFFKHGAKWLTASELAKLGLNKTLKTLPLK